MRGKWGRKTAEGEGSCGRLRGEGESWGRERAGGGVRWEQGPGLMADAVQAVKQIRISTAARGATGDRREH